MAYYWIKLYHEILHDPKMGRLSDPLWRRTIELFLLAGEYGKTGELPSVGEMAWTLRVTDERMVEDLEALAQVNIVHQTDSGWTVTNFASRQDADTDKERKQEQRKRERKVTPIQEPVTLLSRSVTTNVQELKIESELKLEEEGAKPPPPATTSKIPATDQTIERLWQAVTGTPTFYGSTKGDDMRRIEAVFNRNEWDFQKTVLELKGYYDAWINSYSPKTSRKYSKMNTGWLDWALAGEVNGNGGPNNGHKTLSPEERIKIEFAKIERGMK